MPHRNNAVIDTTKPITTPSFHNSKDLTNREFDRLTVTGFAGRNKRGLLIWNCSCKCGGTTLAYGHRLVSGVKRSCGCLGPEVTSKRSVTHGMTKTITYKSWRSMIRRCEAPIDISYKNYGARGVKVCERWRYSFEAFLEDMGERPSKSFQIERKQTSGNYEPSNCCWATRSEQARNKRTNHLLTFNGETMCSAAWADRLGMTRGQLQNRLFAGWSDERALTTPVRKRRTRAEMNAAR